ncbi:MAG: hypothetical protein H7839_13890 [Magnetococcus sp. YQC-5]
MDMKSSIPLTESAALLHQQSAFPPGGIPRTHGRGDLGRVLEVIANWLTNSFPVILVAYWNPRLRKSHLVDHSLSGDQENLENVVRSIMDGSVPRLRHWRHQHWFFHLWGGPPLNAREYLLIVEQGGSCTSDEYNTLIQETIKTFQHDLRQAIQDETCK